MIRVLVVDDQAMVREGFTALLDADPEIQVVGDAADGAVAVADARRLKPDIVLMDVRMPVMDGIEATRQLLADGSDQIRVVMLTTFDIDEYVYEAIQAGASGFLLKDAPAATLVEAVKVVAAGDALLAPPTERAWSDDLGSNALSHEKIRFRDTCPRASLSAHERIGVRPPPHRFPVRCPRPGPERHRLLPPTTRGDRRPVGGGYRMRNRRLRSAPRRERNRRGGSRPGWSHARRGQSQARRREGQMGARVCGRPPTDGGGCGDDDRQHRPGVRDRCRLGGDPGRLPPDIAAGRQPSLRDPGPGSPTMGVVGCLPGDHRSGGSGPGHR